jgi:hypothetical protein
LSKDPHQIESEREASRDQKCAVLTGDPALLRSFADGTVYRETLEIGNDSDPEYPEHWPKEEDLPDFKAVRSLSPIPTAASC